MDRRYADWLQAAEDSGAALAYYECPYCEGQIATLIPDSAEEPFDSLVTCPHCRDMHFKVVWSDGSVVRDVPKPDQEDD